MGKIVLLDELTINQIAAGEVIERPASVVKELVENSIDAGATNICIEIKNGGISYIRITDNGKGIQEDDMEIAFERHATSKIRTAEDLSIVKSMGFRGEALASIAAIANIEMISRTEEEQFGHRILVEGGKVLEKEEAGCARGTIITVKNLFFNTPVRYKFLKKDYTESGYIEDTITRLSLIHPEIAFKLINSGKTVIQTTGDGNIKSCIYSIYGKDIANGIIEVDYTYQDIRVTGIIGKPDIARNNRSNQMFFVNQRFVKDKTLSAAIEQGYKGLLTIGKHAFCILNIDINPLEVDVNVHPAKLEIRFKEENKVFKAVYHTIKENLLNSDLVVESERNDNAKEMPRENNDVLSVENDGISLEKEEKTSRISGLFQRKPRVSFNDNEWNQNKTEEKNLVEELFRQKSQENENKIFNVNDSTSKREEVVQAIEKEEAKQEERVPVGNLNYMNSNSVSQDNNTNVVKEETASEMNFDEMYEKTFGKIQTKPQEKKEEFPEVEKVRLEAGENISVFENKEVYNKINYKFVGIAFSTYIILEIDKELYILDQHAAHERIMYEKVKANFYSDDSKDSQMMLLPDIITLTHKEMDIARENYKMFEKAGFVLEEFGENTIKLTGVPNICMDLDTKELFMNILDEIDTVAITARQEIEDKFIATVACKAAVKANMALDTQEVEHLMNDLLKLPNPFTCPHGRPTAIKMSKIDIEKKFSRR